MRLDRYGITHCAASVALSIFPVSARAAPNDPATTSDPASQIVVTASREDLLGIATTASVGTISGEEIHLRPAYRVGELLESVPGLVVTVHSGEGKANQFLARGFNLDHGTDIANFIDDVPINRPTNAHGEGYSDLNFLMPETLGGLEYTKGTYYPVVGNFGDVASVHLHTANAIPTQITLGGDTFGGFGGYAGGSRPVGADGHVLAAIELSRVNGPFDPAGDFNKYAGVLRYSSGKVADGFDVTTQYYHGAGLFSTDQPARAVTRGLIDRYGSLDPTDGTSNARFSLSSHVARQGENWKFAANAYFVRSSQTLFNNFTHYLEDPVKGDQEEQNESRNLFGGGAAFTLKSRFGSMTSDTTIGLQIRRDAIVVDRRHTLQRAVLDYCELLHADGSVTRYAVGETRCTYDRVRLYDLGLYAENTTHWLPWLRTNVGIRQEFAGGSDRNLLPAQPFSGQPFSGQPSSVRPFSGRPFTQNVALLQPKGSITIGPFARTEFYYSAGRGFHSNDIRSVSGTVLLENIPGYAKPTPLLVKVDSQEVGLRSDLIPKMHIQFAAFLLHVGSEQIYDQDQGEDVPGAASRRYGYEVSAQYLPVRWLEINADLSHSHARFVGDYASFGNTGTYIPNAPEYVGSFGVLVDNLGPVFGGLQVRVLGSLPLVSDNSARDKGYTETNVNLGYTFSPRFKAQVQVFNLMNARANSGAYYYATVIPGDNGIPTADHQNHPLEPISARFSVTATF